MRNWLGIARALLCLLVGHASVTSVNDWVQGVLGPDAWNYSAQDLGTPVVPITDSGRNPYKGVHPSELEAPVAQALRYAHGYVGVHTLYIGGWLLWCAATAEPESALHWQIPLSLVAFEAGAYANALGYFDRDTMGHPRCKNFWHWRGRWGDHPRRAGRETGAKFPTSTVFHSFRPIFGRAIIPRSVLGAWMLFWERARAERSRCITRFPPRWRDDAHYHHARARDRFDPTSTCASSRGALGAASGARRSVRRSADAITASDVRPQVFLSSFYECMEGMKTFKPVLYFDLGTFALAFLGLYPWRPRKKKPAAKAKAETPAKPAAERAAKPKAA